MTSLDISYSYVAFDNVSKRKKNRKIENVKQRDWNKKDVHYVYGIVLYLPVLLTLSVLWSSESGGLSDESASTRRRMRHLVTLWW